MSVWAYSWAFEQDVGQSGAKFVLVALANFADEKGRAYPSQETLAAMTGLKERAVRGHLAYLEEHGFIERQERRSADGKRLSDVCRLLAPPERLAPPAKNAARAEATGKKRHEPPAKNDTSHRQNLPGKRQLEPSGEPSDSPRGAPARPADENGKPAKVLTSMTIDRTREVGFDASRGQIQNWADGWARFVYVPEGREPPSAELQHAVLSEIVAAAAGRLGKTRFFLSVPDAVKRVEQGQRPRAEREQEPRREVPGLGANTEEARKRRKEGYEWLFD